MKRYFAEKEFKGPMLIKFPQSRRFSFTQLKKVYDYFKPCGTFDIMAYDRFEYGDFDNWVTAVYKSILIDPMFSETREDGTVSISVRNEFWYYNKNTQFWRNNTSVGYDSDYHHYKKFEDREISIKGLFILNNYYISYDMDDFTEVNEVQLTEEDMNGLDQWLGRL